jgi:transposase-like protein
MPRSVLDEPRFRDEKAAYAYVESIVWPTGRVCPHCGVVDKSGALKGKSTRIGLYKCYACRKPFTVKVKTIFEKSHIPLHIWLQAMHIMCSSKKGFSANQFCRMLGLDFKSGWFLGHRIRAAMAEVGVVGPLGGEGVFVEADETVIGGKERNKRLSKRNPKNIGAVGKQVAFTLVERNGRARSFHVANVTGATLGPIIMKHVDRKSALMTDDAGQYRPIGRAFARFETVNHGIEEYVRGDAHSNTVEAYFSILKRGITGCYFHVSEALLHRYLAEFDFRHSHRAGLGVDDEARTERAIRGIVGKRLTYRTAGRQATAPSDAPEGWDGWRRV